ncbi:hypothetical protein GUITHDRAFT_136755 [Guillardia theta CCMP2712]|uniref:Leucine-rich repeat-containing N-terminal plant-type domain-containing protein n=1 Tax=Guillardia theta (strain CCMP2712) TaxID=905079 RepID=L1JIT5_GUITC|nr:hypothetical protein GUITHDRAFT_136755 [Guillardia theta CCMP2712]EKX48227.1 hypothetical protein GUITHDRAFT_136755 [Guillardia theta CCMP2712]|eukprot:XP_005835207.1 hypothetical protein GUITHDRAFT_136755 [Guillardia theta CCMP2712]
MMKLGLVLMLLLVSAGGAQQRCSWEDMKYLELLYVGTNGDGWKCGAQGRPCEQPTSRSSGSSIGLAWGVGGNLGWQHNGAIKPSVPDCCLWYGIFCTAEGSSAVSAIVLPHNRLVGALPDGISVFENLEVLDLSANNISGTMPMDISRLERLKDLILFDNLLTGSIPDLRKLLRLEKIVLAENFLEGSIPAAWGELVRIDSSCLQHNLRMIILQENLLTGTIPAELAQLKNLSHLFLHNNELHGTIPRELLQQDRKSNLQYFYVNGNDQPHRLVPELDNEQMHSESGLREVDDDEKNVCKGDKVCSPPDSDTIMDPETWYRKRNIHEYRKHLTERNRKSKVEKVKRYHGVKYWHEV